MSEFKKAKDQIVNYYTKGRITEAQMKAYLSIILEAECQTLVTNQITKIQDKFEKIFNKGIQ